MTFLLANWKLIAIAALAALLATAGILLKNAWAENGALENSIIVAAIYLAP